jgi:putative flippase GtrA
LIARLRNLSDGQRKELTRFLKFSVVGAIGAVVDFSVLNLGMWALQLLNWQANIISFSAAVFSNFMWNRHWTYPESKAHPFGPQLAQFALVNVAGLAINTGILVGLDDYVFPDAWGRWGTNLAKAIAIGVVWFWNYGVNRLWTYRKVK